MCPVGYGGARPGGAALFLLGWILRGHLFYHAGPEIRAEGLAFGVLGLLPQYIFYVAAYFLLATGAGTTGTGMGVTRDAVYRRGLPGNAGAGSWFSRVLCTDRTWGRGWHRAVRPLALVRIFLLFFMGLAPGSLGKSAAGPYARKNFVKFVINFLQDIVFAKIPSARCCVFTKKPGKSRVSG